MVIAYACMEDWWKRLSKHCWKITIFWSKNCHVKELSKSTRVLIRTQAFTKIKHITTHVEPQSHNNKLREHVCLPVKRIFPAVKLRPQTPPIEKREIGDAAIPGERRIHTSLSAPTLPSTRAIGQWARSLEWCHAVTLHTAVGKNCITFFPFSCEACSLYLVLWLWA